MQALKVVCPVCDAPPGVPCQDETGQQVTPHWSRQNLADNRAAGDPLSIRCIQCGAKPGFRCHPDPHKGWGGSFRASPHGLRVVDAAESAGRFMSDAETLAVASGHPCIPAVGAAASPHAGAPTADLELPPTELWMEHQGRAS